MDLGMKHKYHQASMPRISLRRMESSNKIQVIRMQLWHLKPSDMYVTILLYE